MLTGGLGYMKSVKGKMQAVGKPEEEVTAFEKGAQAAAKKLIANFKDLEFYTGESMDPSGMYVQRGNILPFLPSQANTISQGRPSKLS